MPFNGSGTVPVEVERCRHGLPKGGARESGPTEREAVVGAWDRAVAPHPEPVSNTYEFLTRQVRPRASCVAMPHLRVVRQYRAECRAPR